MVPSSDQTFYKSRCWMLNLRGWLIFQASGKKGNASSLLSKKRSEHQTEKCKETQTFGRQITLQV